jgi:RNA polymerase sigma-70 factor (ECF subfamily)
MLWCTTRLESNIPGETTSMSKPQATREDLGASSVTSEARVTLEQLTHEHHDFLFALARKLCRAYFDPADLVQDVLLKTVAHFDRLPAGVNHRAWMSQVMKNLFTDQLRRRKTRAGFDPAELPAAVADDAPWWHQLDADAVRAAVDSLPEELRETFDRFVFRGESYQVIAAALEIPKTTVGTRILRARRRIKVLLTEKQGAG